jgi:hypothetical protein
VIACRGCGGSNVELFLDLGEQPHCNRLIPPERAAEREPHYPLRVGFCHDCTLVQIDHTIPKETMFSDYPYVSGTTRTLVAHFAESAARLVGTYGLGPADLVVDIGSNDGSWLKQYQPFGIRVLGVEAAENVARLAVDAGVPTFNRFFNEATAQQILARHGAARLVTAAGVFFHLEELHSVVLGADRLIGDEGVLVVQAIYLGGMIENMAFDQIYHEHLCYYTLRSLENLLRRHGLEILDVRLLPIHGGSIEVHAARSGRRPVQPGVAAFRAREDVQGLGEIATYRIFAERVWDLKAGLLALLDEWREAGRSVWAYGAPAKGATLLNSFDIGPDLVQRAVEKNPMKVGFAMPGSRLPIVGEGDERPDGYLVLAWNFLDEFLEKEREYLAAGGAFIVPVPKLRVITGGPSS